MGSSVLTMDQVTGNLIEMGFEPELVEEAVKQVGTSMEASVDYLLNNSRCVTSIPVKSQRSDARKNSLKEGSSVSTFSAGKLRQTSIFEHLKPSSSRKRNRTDSISKIPALSSAVISEVKTQDLPVETPSAPISLLFEDPDAEKVWEQRVNTILRKNFRISSLKDFQLEALRAWASHQDCLVLASTGSGMRFIYPRFNSLIILHVHLIMQIKSVIVSRKVSMFSDSSTFDRESGCGYISFD